MSLRKLRWKIILSDRLRYSQTCQFALGLYRYAQGRLRANRPSGLSKLAAAHRILLPVNGERLTLPILKKTLQSGDNPWLKHQIGWNRYREQTKDDLPAISHGLVVKPKSPSGEKGVLVIWVEYNFAALLRSPSLKEILRDYQIVFSTSWSPPDMTLIWALATDPDAELYVIPSNPKDDAWIRQIPVPVRVLPFFASHWIPASDYPEPLIQDSRKQWDFSMIANWAPFKRHWLLYRALSQMPDAIRVALVGQPQDSHTVETSQQLANAFGVRQKIDWFNRLDPTEVRKVQMASHCGLIFSLREGACLAVVESLLADVPVGVISHAHVGSRDFVNDQTGFLLEERHIARDLTALLEKSKSNNFSPRKWALKHAEASLSSKKLNEILKEDATRSGKTWTRSIRPFCLRYARPDYIDPNDWIEGNDWHEEFERGYQIRFLRRN